jgi:DNA-binding IclR family transcriptional regulator
MLASRTPSALEQLAQYLTARTPLTITDPAKFLQEMARTRAQGYGVNRGEWNMNVAGIAAPIVDARGNTIAAVGLSGPKERFKPAQLKAFAPLVIEAAQKISIQLGGRRPMPIWR